LSAESALTAVAGTYLTFELALVDVVVAVIVLLIADLGRARKDRLVVVVAVELIAAFAIRRAFDSKSVAVFVDALIVALFVFAVAVFIDAISADLSGSRADVCIVVVAVAAAAGLVSEVVAVAIFTIRAAWFVAIRAVVISAIAANFVSVRIHGRVAIVAVESVGAVGRFAEKSVVIEVFTKLAGVVATSVTGR